MKTEERLHDIGLGNGFWDLTPEVQTNKRKKLEKLDHIKIKNDCASKDMINRVKRQTTERGTYLQITYLIRG